MEFYVDRLSFKNKPTQEKIGIIRNNIKRLYGKKPQSTLQTLISSIESGRTIQLGVYNSNGDFISQDVLMLDFDNPTQNSAELLYIQNNKFIKENASFIYKSFSYQENIPKFRVVFILRETIKNSDDIKKMYTSLLKEFPQADSVIGQPNRLFFGSNKKIIPINLNNRLRLSSLYMEQSNDINDLDYNIQDTLDSVVRADENIILNNQFELFNSIYSKDKQDTYFDLPIYKLFKLHKYSIIKEKLFEKYGKKYSYVFPDPINASKVFKHEIDMIDFLELPVSKEKEAFSDIFSKDSSPSASVYRHEKSNVQLYKRFNEKNETKQTFDLILAICELTGKNYIETTEKLIELTGSIIDTNSNVYKHKMGVKMFQMFISESETDDLYPYFMNIIRPNTAIIITILDLMSHSYKQVGNEVMLLNNMSVRYLTNHVNRIHNSNHSPQKIAKVLDQLAMFAITKKLKDSEVPKQILNPLVSQKSDKRFQNRANITKVNVDKDNVTDILLDGNNKSKNLLDNNFSMRMMNFEFILNVLGEREAMTIYPQKFTHKTEQLNDEDRKYYQDKLKASAVTILNLVYKDIEDKGYVLEKDVKKQFINLGFSDKDFNYFKPKLINEYGLIRFRFSKDKKIKYSAEDVDGFPYFYVT